MKVQYKVLTPSKAIVPNYVTRDQMKLQNHGHMASALHSVPVYLHTNFHSKLYCLVTKQMCVSGLPRDIFPFLRGRRFHHR